MERMGFSGDDSVKLEKSEIELIHILLIAFHGVRAL